MSVQTVLRQFGNRDGLLDEAATFALHAVVEERRTPQGDVDAAVQVLFDHYERRGDGVVLLLAQESTDARVSAITAKGRAYHRDWVHKVFGTLLRGAEKPDESIDLLVVATDVYTWKLLRRDRKLSRENAEARMRRLVHAVLKG